MTNEWYEIQEGVDISQEGKDFEVDYQRRLLTKSEDAFNNYIGKIDPNYRYTYAILIHSKNPDTEYHHDNYELLEHENLELWML